jgi:hypothetical protein
VRAIGKKGFRKARAALNLWIWFFMGQGLMHQVFIRDGVAAFIERISYGCSAISRDDVLKSVKNNCFPFLGAGIFPPPARAVI